MGKKSQDAKSYALGPQPDGSIILRIPSDFDLMVLRKAVEKQEKNSQAAGGTMSALAEGEDPFLDSVQRSLTKLKSTIAAARAPENQVADTPIGKEIARNKAEASEQGEQIEGQPDGVCWAPHVPKPRPRLGNLIRYPGGESVSVAQAIGFDDKPQAFVVKGADDMQYEVVAHDTGTSTEWRIHGSADKYSTPRVEPKPVSVGDELQEAVSDDERLLRDAPPATADDEGEGTTASAPAAKRPSSKPPIPAKDRTASKAQRSRNAQNAGLRPLPNAAPKPSAAKKGGNGKGRKR